MLSWKEKVSQRLSRLLAETSSSPPSPSKDYSVVCSVDSELARITNKRNLCPWLKSLGKEIFSQEFASPVKEEDFTSSLSSLENSQNSAVNETKTKSLNHLHGLNSSPQYLLAKKWSTNIFSWRERSSTFTPEGGKSSEFEEMPKSSEENMDHFPDTIVNGSHETDEASTPHDPDKYLSFLTERSTFMTANLFEFFISCLPNIVKGCQWILLYSTWKHGISLQTLLRNSLDLPGPCLLIAGDMQGAIFGGLLDGPLKPTAKRKYQGTSQAFVFSTIYGEPRLFRATGENRFYYMCLNDQLAFGGGGNYALSIEEDLLHGTSGPCQTFGNVCLAHNAEFELKNVELWGFAHSSRYLTCAA